MSETEPQSRSSSAGMSSASSSSRASRGGGAGPSSSGEGPSSSSHFEETGPPPNKMSRVMFEAKKLASISSLDQMDAMIWEFQIAKIRERLEARTKEENEIKLRIEQLEKRQTQDDAVLNVVNRYWNQLNEDIRIMLQRFDTETSDEVETNNENAATTSFLEEMKEWDKNELDEKLSKKVQVSTRAVTKMIQAFDRLFQRSEKLCAILKAEVDGEDTPDPVKNLNEEVKQEYIHFLEMNKQVQLTNTSLHAKFRTMSLKMKDLAEKLMGEETEIDELKNRVSDLEYEFEEIGAECKKKADMLLTWKDKVKEIEDQLGKDSFEEPEKDVLTSGELICLQKEQEELMDLAEQRKCELEQLKQQHISTLHEIDRLNKEIQNIPEYTVMETTEYKCLQSKFSVVYQESQQLRQQIQEIQRSLYSVNAAQVSQIKDMELEEVSVQKILQADMTHLEDTLSQLKKEYEMLRLEFEKNAAANEQVAPVHREMRNLITQLQQHNQQIKAEGQKFRTKCCQLNEENAKIKKYNTEMIQKLEKLQQLRKQGQLGSSHHSSSSSVKLEVKAEPGPSTSTAAIAAGTSSSSSASTSDVKPDVKELKSKVKKEDESPVKVELAAPSSAEGTVESSDLSEEKKIKLDPGTAKSIVKSEEVAAADAEVKPEGGDTQEKSEPSSSSSTTTATFAAPAPPPAPTAPPPKKISDAEQAQIQDLKSQLKRCLSDTKEIKVLLDMHKRQNNKEQTERIDALISEKKAMIELEEVKLELKRMQENAKKEEKKKVAEEDLSQKMKVLEERVTSLKRQIGAQKQEEEALLAEMDVTGQAFEDMQEQNSRLIQQLREKENANFKLMSDRIKANRVQELLKEEKEAQQRNNQILMEHLQHKNTVIRKLEEIEQQLVSTIAIMEREAMVRQQAMELNKRKAIESAQSAADLKLHLEKYHSQMKEAQQLVAEKTSALAAEAFKSKRYSEELSILTSRLERLKKIEMSGNTDQVLMAEIQEYKDMLTCPSCKVRRKDAVLTKCFHVFCFDCLRTRYETRQRKCPRCNAAFGANDYHRLYLS